MALSLKNSLLRGVTLSAILPNLFLNDNFDGIAQPLNNHVPDGFPGDNSYGFGPWVIVSGTPATSGSNTAIFNPGDSASITSTGAVTYAASPGGYIITLGVFSLSNTDFIITQEGVLPNGIQYRTTAYGPGFSHLNAGKVLVEFGPSLAFSMLTGAVTIGNNGIDFFIGPTAQSVEVGSIEEATATQSLTFSAGNNVSMMLTVGGTAEVQISRIQIDY
jgi:hypothetical protein